MRDGPKSNISDTAGTTLNYQGQSGRDADIKKFPLEVVASCLLAFRCHSIFDHRMVLSVNLGYLCLEDDDIKGDKRRNMSMH